MTVYVAAGFIAGAWVGALVGMLIWNDVVTRRVRDAYRDHQVRSANRVQAWQRMYLYAEGERVATSKAMVRAINPEPDVFSRKVPDLKAVQ